MTRTVRVCAAVLATALLLAGCSSQKTVEFSGTVMNSAVGAGSLTTDEGAPYELSKDTTKPLTLVFFGYTHCPDICPTVLSSIASGLAKLSSGERAQVQVLFVTSDPKRDTPAALKSYLDRFDPGFTGLTGNLSTISSIGRSIGIFVDEGEQLASGGYDPNSHSSYVIGVDKSHQATVVWDGDTAPAQYARDIRFLLAHGTAHLESSNG